MALRVMLLDMLKLRRLPKRRNIPIQIPQPLVQCWVPTPDIADIAFEMLYIHRVKPHNGRIQANVSLGDLFAKVVRFFERGVGCEMFFSAVEGRKERLDGFFIGVLGGGKARFVDAVVDVVVCPVVGTFDLGLKMFGEKIDVFIFFGDDVVEFGIEVADDFTGLDACE